MNEIIKRNSTALAALANLRKNLANATAALPTTRFEPYLRMEKDGGWLFGQDNVRVHANDRLVVNPLSLEHGYNCWTRYEAGGNKSAKKNEKLGEFMVPAGQPKPVVSSLPDHAPWTWQNCLAITMKFNAGPNKGTQVLYNTNSVGGIDRLGALVNLIQARIDEDREDVFPVIKLGSDFYIHKQWGKTYTPVFEIVQWVDMDGNAIDDEYDNAAEVDKAEEARLAAETLAAAPAKVETAKEKLLRELAELEAAESAAVNKAVADDMTVAATPVRRRRAAA